MRGRKPGANRSGLDYENEVAFLLRKVFDDARRLGTDAHGDVAAGPLLVEVKNTTANASLRGAFRQCCEALGHHDALRFPAAVCKTKGAPQDALVTMRFRDLLELLMEMQQGKPQW